MYFQEVGGSLRTPWWCGTGLVRSSRFLQTFPAA